MNKLEFLLILMIKETCKKNLMLPEKRAAKDSNLKRFGRYTEIISRFIFDMSSGESCMFEKLLHFLISRHDIISDCRRYIVMVFFHLVTAQSVGYYEFASQF